MLQSFGSLPAHGPFTLYVYLYALIIVGQWAKQRISDSDSDSVAGFQPNIIDDSVVAAFDVNSSILLHLSPFKIVTWNSIDV